MVTTFSHIPVLRDAVLELAATAAPKRIIDCTVGGAGHATALLEHFPEASLLGIDRDPEAVAIATERLARFAGRAQVLHGAFSDVHDLMQSAGWPHADAILADFGVSSFQLDTAARGFSFRADAALDMRMDPTAGVPVYELIEQMDETQLANVIYTLGEERQSRRIARAVVQDKPRTTQALADIIRRVMPRSKDKIDPATRTFQALRMLVNHELEEINTWLAQAPLSLAQGGVLLAISFHSLEDRAVKLAFRAGAQTCVCPPSFPVCTCAKVSTLKVLTSKARVGDAAEIAKNPRARSARLRAAQKL
jgi:16S rRNA (cytosine1402-N4)-methyltransferase